MEPVDEIKIVADIDRMIGNCIKFEDGRFILKDNRYKDILPIRDSLVKFLTSKYISDNDIERLNQLLMQVKWSTDAYLGMLGYPLNVYPKSLQICCNTLFQHYHDLMDYIKTLSNDSSILIPQSFFETDSIVKEDQERKERLAPPIPTEKLNQLIERFVNTPLPDDNDLLKKWERDLRWSIFEICINRCIYIHDEYKEEKHVLGELLRVYMNKATITRSDFYTPVHIGALDLVLDPEENGKYEDLLPLREELLTALRREREEEKK